MLKLTKIVCLLLACMLAPLAAQVPPEEVPELPRPPGASIQLAWNRNPEPNIAGYRIYWGTEAGKATNVLDVGNVITAVVPLPQSGVYYFMATAYDTGGLESLPSAEIRETVLPGTPGGVRRVVFKLQSSVDLKEWETIAEVGRDMKEREFARVVTEILPE